MVLGELICVLWNRFCDRIRVQECNGKNRMSKHRP